MKKYGIIFLFWVLTGVAQPTASHDTSFTIQATFQKEVKKFPFIKIAEPVKRKELVQQNDIVYRRVAGRELRLDIYYSGTPLQKARPAVLLIFGGGWRSGDKSHNKAMAIELANRGYVAVSAEYRLSGEALFPAAIHDLKAAVRWMREQAIVYGIDTAKIAAIGCSAGGQLAALMGTTNNKPDFEDREVGSLYSSMVQAVVDIDGILAFKHPESGEGVSASLWLGGSYEQKPEVWKNASALTHVDSLTAPILFINSALPRFHAGRDDMMARLRGLKIYSEQHTIPDTPHPFWFFDPWFKPMMNYITHFLGERFAYRE